MPDFGWNDPQLFEEIQAAMKELDRRRRSRTPDSHGPAATPIERDIAALGRYLSREDYAWLWVRDPRAARRRWWWNCGQFLRLCCGLARAQRRISRARAWQQAASLQALIGDDLRVYAGIAAVAGRGLLHFAGIRYDSGEIAARFLALSRAVRPHAAVIRFEPAGLR